MTMTEHSEKSCPRCSGDVQVNRMDREARCLQCGRGGEFQMEVRRVAG